jgi:hypothetical protein
VNLRVGLKHTRRSPSSKPGSSKPGSRNG